MENLRVEYLVSRNNPYQEYVSSLAPQHKDFNDIKSAEAFIAQLENTWETEEKFYKDRKTPHVVCIKLMSFDGEKWNVIKTSEYRDWFSANKHRWLNKDDDDDEIMQENYRKMSKKVTLKESELLKLVTESVMGVLNEMNPELEPLNKMSRSYHPNMDMQQNILDKTFNNGNGSLAFVEIIPDEKVLLVNSSIATRKDMERIQQCFPEYKVEEVSLGYPDWYSNRNLRSMRQK